MMPDHDNAEARCVRLARDFYLAAQSKVAGVPELALTMDPNDEESERLEEFHMALYRASRADLTMPGIHETMDRNPQIALPLLDLLVEILRRSAPDEFLKTCLPEQRVEGAEDICRRHRAHNLAAMFAP